MINIQLMNLLKEIKKSVTFQVSCAITFGVLLLLSWLKEPSELNFFLVFLFLLPFSLSLLNLINNLVTTILIQLRLRKNRNNLTIEEANFISYYLLNKTKTRYAPCFNGTYKNSGIINPLIHKKILYLASTLSEYRNSEQHFPINIYDNSYSFYEKNPNVLKNLTKKS